MTTQVKTWYNLTFFRETFTGVNLSLKNFYSNFSLSSSTFCFLILLNTTSNIKVFKLTNKCYFISDTPIPIYILKVYDKASWIVKISTWSNASRSWSQEYIWGTKPPNSSWKLCHVFIFYDNVINQGKLKPYSGGEGSASFLL